MLQEKEPRPYIITEYMGPGCPDIYSRPIWFSARDPRFVVAYKVGIYEESQKGELAEVYALDKDPNAYYDIKDKIEIAEIQYLLDAIEQRCNEIKSETNVYIAELKT